MITDKLFIATDIDECRSNKTICGKLAQCTNAPGSYVCSCGPEYTGDPKSSEGCRDLDECQALDRPCGTHAICENASPGYNCICPQGYREKPNPQIACEQVTVVIVLHVHAEFINFV